MRNPNHFLLGFKYEIKIVSHTQNIYIVDPTKLSANLQLKSLTLPRDE